MTKTIEIHFCDICGKEITHFHNGGVHIDDGRCYPANRFIKYEEVCADCCDKILAFVDTIKVVKK